MNTLTLPPCTEIKSTSYQIRATFEKDHNKNIYPPNQQRHSKAIRDRFNTIPVTIDASQYLAFINSKFNQHEASTLKIIHTLTNDAGGRLLRNLERTIPLLPCDRATFPQMQRCNDPFFLVFALYTYAILFPRYQFTSSGVFTPSI